MTRTFDTTPGPHRPPDRTVRNIMASVLLALVPGIVAHTVFFGPGVLIQIVLASIFALAFETLMLYLRGRPLAPFLADYSAIVAAVLFALCIPPLAPWWVSAVAMFFAIVVAKHLYGGLGHNVFNPAMVGYVVVLISFPLEMTQWLEPRPLADWTPGLIASLQAVMSGTLSLPDTLVSVDAVTGATPLDTLKTGLDQGLAPAAIREAPIFGASGAVGWSWIAVAYALGGAWLLWRRVIRWQIPVATLGGAVLITLPFWLLDPASHASPLQHVAAGGLVLAAFFIATDPVSGSTTNRGRLVFGFGVASLTLVIRRWGGYPDGIAFAVLLMNMTVPLIDRFTRPRVYGQ
jgi:electron transport complex protein RnfD